MHFQVKMPENGRKNIFRDNQKGRKIPLMFLDTTDVLMEKYYVLGRCHETSKVQCFYLSIRPSSGKFHSTYTNDTLFLELYALKT